MNIPIILLIIIIGACLANSTIALELESFTYGRGDYNPSNYVSNNCPCLSCIDQPCASSYKS